MKWGKTDHHQSMIRTSSKGGMVLNAINMFELNLTQSQTDEVWVCKLANRKLSPCPPALKKGASLVCLSVQSLISHLCTQSGLSREDQTVRAGLNHHRPLGSTQHCSELCLPGSWHISHSPGILPSPSQFLMPQGKTWNSSSRPGN